MIKQTKEAKYVKEKLATAITDSFHDQMFITIRMLNQQQGEHEIPGIVT